MSGPVTLDKEGRRKVTLVDVSTIEQRQLSQRDVLILIYQELRKLNAYMAEMTDEEIAEDDLDEEDL